jgi:hypothetical protein
MSYTLRRITKDKVQNTYLGKEYFQIDRETNYEEFCKTYELLFGENHVADLDSESNSHMRNHFGFIISEGAKDIHSLLKYQSIYIVSESGKTFSNLTYK